MSLLNCIKLYQNQFDIVPKITIRNSVYQNVQHKAIKILVADMSYIFQCYIYINMAKEYAIAYLDNVTTILCDDTISVTEKEYCIELFEKVTDTSELWINFIQKKEQCRLPNKLGTKCMGAGGIMGLIFAFLDNINFNNSVYLSDDSQIMTQKTLLPRLICYKESIYANFGFIPAIIDVNKYNLVLEKLRHTMIQISPGTNIYLLLPEEIKALNNKFLSLYDLYYIFGRPSDIVEGTRNAQFFAELPADIKRELLFINKYYEKMVNIDYKKFLVCGKATPMIGGTNNSIYIHKLKKYLSKLL